MNSKIRLFQSEVKLQEQPLQRLRKFLFRVDYAMKSIVMEVSHCESCVTKFDFLLASIMKSNKQA
jgi:hypothetical protein